MKAICGHCQGRHDTIEEYRSCSAINANAPMPSGSKKRISKNVGRPKRSEHPLLDEMRDREERRHQEALQRRRNPTPLRRSVTTDSAVVEIRGEHKLTGFVSAGVNEMNRAMTPWAGSCSCRAWRRTCGDRATLVAMWHIHVNESEVDPS